MFLGPTAVIWAEEDPVTPAKALSEFAKEHENFKLKGAVVDGSLVDGSGIEALAKMPSKEQLLSKLLALMNAPATQLLRTIQAPSAQFARLLGAWKTELESKEQ